MWETRIREGRTAPWKRALVVGLGGALLLVLALAPGARAATVDHFSISNRTVTEGNAGTVDARFTIGYTGPKGDLSVDWSTTDGTALAGVDFVASSGTATFTAGGPRSVTITIPVIGDALDEANETFFVDLSNPQPVAIADVTVGRGVGTINDDDPLPSIAIDDPAVAEGDGGTTTMIYTIRLSAPSGRAVNVRASTANGTATQPADYVASTQSLVFTPGATTLTFPVTVKGDVLDEADADTVLVNLSSVTNATVADGRGVGSILDDDSPPSIAIAIASRSEGNAGTANLAFTVRLTPASGRTVTVGWSTSDGSALAPADYTASSGTVTFSAGQTTKTVSVPVVGDLLDEPNETLLMDLSTPTNATISDGQAIGTIVDDDGPPRLSVSDTSVSEGDAGTVTATFTVSLSVQSGFPITVAAATTDGTASSGTDYAGVAGGVAFAPGDLTATVDVAVNGDVLDEPDETFTLVLSTPANATLLDGSGLGTILDDDLPPELSVADLAVVEGDSGSSTASVAVSLTAASGRTITIDYATVDGTASSGSDYVAAAGTLSFAPGETSAAIDVGVNGDVTFEDDEELSVVLSGETNAQLVGPSAAVKIANDDQLPALSVDDVSIAEGDAGDAALSFTVSLANPSAFPVSVDVASTDGTATQPGDYASLASTLVFPPGLRSLPVDLTVHGDAVFERDERLTVDLSNPSGATIADGSGVGTIVNDDATPIVDVAGVTLNEGDAGDSSATFVLSLTGSTDLPASVDVATAEGTAWGPSDFTPVATTVTFATGETMATVDVSVHGDTVYENDEDFTLQLAGPEDAAIGTGTATATIVNDDPMPAASIADATVIEGNAGPTIATLTLSLTNASAFPTAVDVATADGSAGAPLDLAAAAGTVSFAPGELSATFDVAVTGDLLYEGDETFSVVLSNPVGITLGDDAGVVTIIDDEGRPVLSVGDVTVLEPDVGTTSAVFRVSLSTPSSFPVAFEYTTVDGTAEPGDYTPAAGTQALAPGTVDATIAVDVDGDPTVETDESFTLELRNPVGALLADASGVGTILNDDRPPRPSLSVDDVSVPEGDRGSGYAAFTVRLSRPSDEDVVAGYLTADETASGGDDYGPSTGEITIPAGGTVAEIRIPIFADRTNEPDERFRLELAWVNGATLGAGGTATIANDDQADTRMSVTGRGIDGSRVTVRGRLIAMRAGLQVDVTLFRRLGDRWVEVEHLGVRTIASGRVARTGDVVTIFRTRFRHQEAGRYLVRAAFQGDDLQAGSHARSRFRLR